MWFRIAGSVSLLLFLVACAMAPPPSPPVEVAGKKAVQDEFKRAQVLETQGKEREALILYRDVLEKEPSTSLGARAAFRAAGIYWKRGYWEKALELLHKAAQWVGPGDPLYHRSYLLMARILFQQGDMEKARSYLDEVNPSMVPGEEYRSLKEALEVVPPKAPKAAKYEVILVVEHHPLLKIEEDQMEKGVALALEGSGVELEVVSSPSDWDSLEGEFLGVVGPLLAKSLPPVLEKARERNLPVVTPFPVVPGWAGRDPLLFRTSLPLDQEVSFMAGFLRKEMSVDTLAIFYPSTPYGRVMARLMNEEFQALGGRVELVESYPSDTKDFSAYASELKEREDQGRLPQALFVPDSWRRVVLLVPQLVYHDVKGISLAGTALWDDPRLVGDGGGYVEYAVFPDTYTANSPYLPVLEFYYRFLLTYGMEPTPLAAQAYDAVRALLARMSQGDGLIPLGDVSFLGVTGMTGFDSQGDPVRMPFLLVVEGGTIRQMN